MGHRPGGGIADLLEALDAGEQPEEGELAAFLRRPGCPGELVERLARCTWVLASARLVRLLVTHPRCPRHFAWEALGRLGWHDLVQVGRAPRTAPAVRAQCERKLVERIPNLTLGERTALARVAPRGVVVALLASDEPRCIEAVLDNPQFTEAEALRLLLSNRNPLCLLALIRHRSWGRRTEIVRAAVRTRAVPLGVALGLLPSLPQAELAGLASSPDVPPPLRDAAANLAERRRETGAAKGGSSPSCSPRRKP